MKCMGCMGADRMGWQQSKLCEIQTTGAMINLSLAIDTSPVICPLRSSIALSAPPTHTHTHKHTSPIVVPFVQ